MVRRADSYLFATLQTMWDRLNLVRIYTKPKGSKVPDYTAPVVLRRTHCTVEDFCGKIHKSVPVAAICLSSLPLTRRFSRVQGHRQELEARDRVRLEREALVGTEVRTGSRPGGRGEFVLQE